MTDREKLIEEAAKAIAKAANADYWTDEIAEWEDAEEWEREAYPDERPHMAYEDREESRKQARAVLAVFDKAHAPTDDERIERALDYIENGTMPPERREWLRALALRRAAVQEPSDEDVCAWCPRPSRGTAIWQGHDQREPSCGEDDHGMRFERTAAPTVRDHVRCLTEATDAELDELGGLQGEPTDAQLAEIEQRVYDEHHPRIAGMAKALVRAGWDAALRAAAAVREEGQGR